MEKNFPKACLPWQCCGTFRGHCRVLPESLLLFPHPGKATKGARPRGDAFPGVFHMSYREQMPLHTGVWAVFSGNTFVSSMRRERQHPDRVPMDPPQPRPARSRVRVPCVFGRSLAVNWGPSHVGQPCRASLCHVPPPGPRRAQLLVEEREGFLSCSLWPSSLTPGSRSPNLRTADPSFLSLELLEPAVHSASLASPLP